MFLLLFRSLKLGEEQQRRILLWGVLGAIVLRGLQINQRRALVDRLSLERRQLERPLLVPHALEPLRGTVLDTQLLVHAAHCGDGRRRRPLAIEPGRDAVVGELGSIHHHGAVDVGGTDAAIGRNRELDDHAEPLHALRQAGDVERQPLGQHRERLCGGIHRGRVGTGVHVDGRARRNRGIDVGYGHEDPDRAARERLGHGELIQVTRIVVVDRAPGQRAQVADPWPPLHGGRCDALQLLADPRREVRLETVVEHRATRDGLQPVGPVLRYRHRGMIAANAKAKGAAEECSAAPFCRGEASCLVRFVEAYMSGIMPV